MRPTPSLAGGPNCASIRLLVILMLFASTAWARIHRARPLVLVPRGPLHPPNGISVLMVNKANPDTQMGYRVLHSLDAEHTAGKGDLVSPGYFGFPVSLPDFTLYGYGWFFPPASGEYVFTVSSSSPSTFHLLQKDNPLPYYTARTTKENPVWRFALRMSSDKIYPYRFELENEASVVDFVVKFRDPKGELHANLADYSFLQPVGSIGGNFANGLVPCDKMDTETLDILRDTFDFKEDCTVQEVTSQSEPASAKIPDQTKVQLEKIKEEPHLESLEHPSYHKDPAATQSQPSENTLEAQNSDESSRSQPSSEEKKSNDGEYAEPVKPTKPLRQSLQSSTPNSHPGSDLVSQVQQEAHEPMSHKMTPQFTLVDLTDELSASILAYERKYPDLIHDAEFIKSLQELWSVESKLDDELGAFYNYTPYEALVKLWMKNGEERHRCPDDYMKALEHLTPNRVLGILSHRQWDKDTKNGGAGLSRLNPPDMSGSNQSPPEQRPPGQRPPKQSSSGKSPHEHGSTEKVTGALGRVLHPDDASLGQGSSSRTVHPTGQHPHQGPSPQGEGFASRVFGHHVPHPNQGPSEKLTEAPRQAPTQRAPNLNQGSSPQGEGFASRVFGHHDPHPKQGPSERLTEAPRQASPRGSLSSSQGSSEKLNEASRQARLRDPPKPSSSGLSGPNHREESAKSVSPGPISRLPSVTSSSGEDRPIPGRQPPPKPVEKKRSGFGRLKKFFTKSPKPAPATPHSPKKNSETPKSKKVVAQPPASKPLSRSGMLSKSPEAEPNTSSLKSQKSVGSTRRKPTFKEAFKGQRPKRHLQRDTIPDGSPLDREFMTHYDELARLAPSPSRVNQKPEKKAHVRPSSSLYAFNQMLDETIHAAYEERKSKREPVANTEPPAIDVEQGFREDSREMYKTYTDFKAGNEQAP